MSQQNTFVENCLRENLQAVGMPIKKELNGLRFGQGTPMIYVQEVEVWQPDSSEIWLAHVEVVFALNPEITETYLYDCATGSGNSPEAAMVFAAEAMCKSSVPPIFSLLSSKAILGAEYFPPDDPYGFLDWEAFSSPYVLRGNEIAGKQLIKYVQETPLSSSVATLLEDSLDKPMLNTVRLYLGFDGTKYHAECRVNNKLNELGKQALLNANLPDLKAFASLNQFILLLQRPHASA